MPFVIIVALVIGSASGGFGGGGSSPSGPLPAVSAAVPPNSEAQLANCTKVLEKLPVTLGTLKPRVVHTARDTPTVVAWGDPAVIFSCGVAKPEALHPGSDLHPLTGGEQTGPYYDVTSHGDANIWTTIDRAPYIAITLPSKYQGADYIPLISKPIAQALPAVCDPTGQAADPAKLCTRRTT